MKNYSEEEIKKLDEEYIEISNKYLNLNWTEFAKKISSLNHKGKLYFQRKMIDDVLHEYCYGYYIYIEKESDFYSGLKEIILKTVKLLPEGYYFWWNIYYFFKNDKKNLEKTLEKYFEVNKKFFNENKLNEGIFVDDFLDVYKNAYSGFWKKMSERFKKLECYEAEKLCNLFEDFYYKCKTYSEKENLLVNYIQENPETILAKEFLA